MLEKLVEDAYNNDYFKKVYELISKQFTYDVLGLASDEISKKILRDALRFADIFSNSNDEKMQNLSQKIISLLYDKYNNENIFVYYSNAILKKTNNYPALTNLKYIELPKEREVEYMIDRDLLKAPISDTSFLPNQYYIYNKIRNDESLSFSGPTSMGKSFIIKEFIINSIKSKEEKNFCIVVPSRALIKQYTLDFNKVLKKENLKSHKVVTSANILEYVDIEKQNYIFIFTPERLNILLYSQKNIELNYLIIDEAHKLFDTDNRGLTSYSTIDYCKNRYKNIKIIFSTPLIQNPEIFKESYNKLDIENYSTKHSPVSQNLFYINFTNKSVKLIDNSMPSLNININNYLLDKNYLFRKIGAEDSNIIYINGVKGAVDAAREFNEYIDFNKIKLLKEEDIEKVENVCKSIENNIHKDFYLINFLKNGIGYHFGKLPLIVREQVEELFKTGVIKYLFCTSTLLEGVNLPVKNIFIMSNYIGRKKMSNLDFWNLSGRAGRLGYEYYGNVFCVKISEGRSWEKSNVLYEKNKVVLEDSISIGLMKNKQAIKKIIKGEKIEKQNEYINYLANIIQIDSITNKKSSIYNKVLEIDKNIIESCEEKDNSIDYEIISSSKNIDYKLQKNILKSEKELLFYNDINYKNCLELLEILYDKYQWGITEKRFKKKESLQYIAKLVNEWVNDVPLNQIINNNIEYKNKNKKDIYLVTREIVQFDKKNMCHINQVIDDIIFDIESTIRFVLEKYFNNYYNILKAKYPEKEIGVNWALYFEFGTRNIKNIMLQNAGFSRYMSNILIKKYHLYLEFQENEFKGIKKEILKDNNLINSGVFYEISKSPYLIP